MAPFFAILLIFVFLWIFIASIIKKEREQKEHERIRLLEGMKDGLSYIKVLGTRTATNTVDNVHVNSTLYSLLLVYSNGQQQTVEVGSQDMYIFNQYIQA